MAFSSNGLKNKFVVDRVKNIVGKSRKCCCLFTDLSKLKDSADDNFTFDENGGIFFQKGSQNSRKRKIAT